MKYKFAQDCKYSVWRRTEFEVEAESQEEANELVKAEYNERITSYPFPDINDFSFKHERVTESEYTVEDSREFMLPSDNNGLPTTEIFADPDDSELLIMSI